MPSETMTKTIATLGEKLKARGWFAGCAESCTGGLIASTLTDVAGSSEWFYGSVVAYANEIKEGLLGVEPAAIESHGAVSRQVVEQMAPGACRILGCNCAVAVSGIAGPGGGTLDKPVGTVWMAWTIQGQTWARKFQFDGTRAEVKAQTVQEAITGLLERL